MKLLCLRIGHVWVLRELMGLKVCDTCNDVQLINEEEVLYA